MQTRLESRLYASGTVWDAFPGTGGDHLDTSYQRTAVDAIHRGSLDAEAFNRLYLLGDGMFPNQMYNFRSHDCGVKT
eukprot:1187220-Prorocentrum_minimum.AAC.5